MHHLFYPDGTVTVVSRFEVLHKHWGRIFAKEVKPQLQKVPSTCMHLTVHLQQGGRDVCQLQ